jgi:hypothetical protein
MVFEIFKGIAINISEQQFLCIYGGKALEHTQKLKSIGKGITVNTGLIHYWYWYSNCRLLVVE